MTDTTLLNELCYKIGVWHSFIDRGQNKEYIADKKSKQVICKALGYPAGNAEQIKRSLRKFELNKVQTFVSYTKVVQEWELHPLSLDFYIPKREENATVSWILTTEDGTVQSGSFAIAETALNEELEVYGKQYQRRTVSLQLNAPTGYHHLAFESADFISVSNRQMRLIVVPVSCYMPEIFQHGRRVYGFPLQLYALKSEHNWGMGDFSDLSKMATIAEELGASLVGINPITALFADAPEDASPYCATSRIFLNPLYIDTETVPESSECPAYKAFKETPDFQKTLAKSRGCHKVLYTDVAKLKYKTIRILFEFFKKIHLSKTTTARGKAFLNFCENHEPFLTNFATFQALREQAIRQKKSLCWWKWERGFKNPQDTKIKAFQTKHADDILFIKYQQFLAFEQYGHVANVYQKSDLPIGLYTDLPVGVGENSAEVWSNQTAFMRDVTAGAPPDAFNKKGQDWSLAPFHPFGLRQLGYEPFVRVVRSAMAGAGAVRIDHAFGLMRLFLRVKGGSGAYISYSFKDMMGIVALESHRNQCLVIAEDLGTAPDGFHEEMLKSAALSFKILHFEKCWDGLRMPQDYEHRSLIASGTHDLPSYTAFWKGLDLELGKEMKTLSLVQYRAHKKGRVVERQQFVSAFKKLGLPLSDAADTYETHTVPEWFIDNVYRFLAKTNSMVLLVRLEDLVAQDEQVNLPGTYMEYPNWRYKLPVAVESLEQNENVARVCEMLKQERPRPIKENK